MRKQRTAETRLNSSYNFKTALFRTNYQANRGLGLQGFQGFYFPHITKLQPV